MEQLVGREAWHACTCCRSGGSRGIGSLTFAPVAGLLCDVCASQFAPAAGSYLLATRLTGWLYDKAAAEHGDPHECIGPDCFRAAFLLLSGLAVVSSLACSIATSRSRRAYLALAVHLRQVDIAEHTSGADDS